MLITKSKTYFLGSWGAEWSKALTMKSIEVERLFKDPFLLLFLQPFMKTLQNMNLLQEMNYKKGMY